MNILITIIIKVRKLTVTLLDCLNDVWRQAGCILLLAVGLYYCIIGTDGNIDEIRARAPIEIPKRGWEIMREEGYQYGNFGKHGGYVWYHVRNTNNHSIQYRVKVTLWGNKLEYWYGAPEKLNRFNVTYKNNIED